MANHRLAFLPISLSYWSNTFGTKTISSWIIHLTITIRTSTLRAPIFITNSFVPLQPCSLIKFSEPLKSQSTTEGIENESVSSTSTVRLPMTLNNNEDRSMLRRKSLVQEAKMYYIHFNSSSLERYSRVAFPLMFAIFNMAYWLSYLGPGHGIWWQSVTLTYSGIPLVKP